VQTVLTVFSHFQENAGGEGLNKMQAQMALFALEKNPNWALLDDFWTEKGLEGKLHRTYIFSL